jgi:hypothetical protein
VSLIATWVFSLASSVSRVCVGVHVPWFVCNTFYIPSSRIKGEVPHLYITDELG